MLEVAGSEASEHRVSSYAEQMANVDKVRQSYHPLFVQVAPYHVGNLVKVRRGGKGPWLIVTVVEAIQLMRVWKQRDRRRKGKRS